MRRVSLVLIGCLLVVPVLVQGADFGFGIPDMVEEKVEDLDEKVRTRGPSGPALSNLRGFDVDLSEADTDFISASTIAPNEQRIYATVNFNNQNKDKIQLIQLDGQGNELAREDLIAGGGGGSPADTTEQLAFAPNDKVDVLTQVQTPAGPAALFFRFRDNNAMSLINDELSLFAGTDTAVSVNQFAYGEDENVYLAGDSGVFSLSGSGFSSAPGRGRWGNRFQEKFFVPDDSLITRGDSIFLASIENQSVTGNEDTFVVTALNADSSVAWTDTQTFNPGAGPNFNSKTRVLAGPNGSPPSFFVYYQQDRTDTSAIFEYDYQNGGTLDTGFYDVQFNPSIHGNNSNIFGGTESGTVIQVDGTNLSASIDRQNISDSATEVVLQGSNREIYTSSLEGVDGGAGGFVNALDLDGDGDISDTGSFAPGGTAFTRVPPDETLSTRPVWLKDGFLGIVFNGGRITADDQAGQSFNISDGSWPHKDANNQYQRCQQNTNQSC